MFFARHGLAEEFGQSDLDWIVGQSMKKKIFSLLLRAGWIKKASRSRYVCVSPEKVIVGLLEFRVPKAMGGAERPYAFTGLSAIEIWSDYSYVQRGREKSPHFIKVLKGDLPYWKHFFGKMGIPFYVNRGATVGEYVVLEPVMRINRVEKGGLSVISLREAARIAKANDAYAYPYNYMRGKYGTVAT